jgi:hypothetical protein
MAMSNQVSISNGIVNVEGSSMPLNAILGVETYYAENPLRNGLILLTGLVFPIASMIIFALFVEQPNIRYALGIPTALGPFIALLIGLFWPRPWGTIIEGPTQYRCLYKSSDKAEVEAVTATIRNALTKK